MLLAKASSNEASVSSLRIFSRSQAEGGEDCIRLVMGAKTGPDLNLTHLFLENKRWRWAERYLSHTASAHPLMHGGLAERCLCYSWIRGPSLINQCLVV